MPLSLVSVMVLRETIRPLRVEGDDCGGRDLREDVAGDVAGHLLEPDAVAAAAGDFAIGDADVAPAEEMDQPAPRRQRNAAAVEGEAGQADAVGAFALEHRSAAGEDEFGRAAHADQLGAVLQPQHAGAIDAGWQRQRHLCPRSLVDRALELAVWSSVLPGRTPYCVASRPSMEVSGAARAASGDMASAPAMPAVDAPMR